MRNQHTHVGQRLVDQFVQHVRNGDFCAVLADAQAGGFFHGLAANGIQAIYQGRKLNSDHESHTSNKVVIRNETMPRRFYP
ncbi:hypothetical protein D3C85_1371990 [compost metagenome]